MVYNWVKLIQLIQPIQPQVDRPTILRTDRSHQPTRTLHSHIVYNRPTFNPDRHCLLDASYLLQGKVHVKYVAIFDVCRAHHCSVFNVYVVLSPGYAL